MTTTAAWAEGDVGPRAVRVLYLNHTSVVSGGEESLLELVAALPADWTPLVAAPRGPLADRAVASGVTHLPVPGTAGSLRLQPLHTPRALADMLAAAIALRAHVRRTRPSLIHANSIRAGMIVALAGCLSRRPLPPLVVHVRDRLPPSRLSTNILKRTAKAADLMIANSHFTAEGIPPTPTPVEVVTSPVDLERFAPRHDRDAARTLLGLDLSAVVLSVIAQLTPWKAQDDAIRILRGLRDRGHDAVLVLAGEAKFVDRATRFDNIAFRRGLEGLVQELGLAGHVRFLGEVEDVRDVLAATDVLLLPSWEEPLGRAVIEALAMGVPVVATTEGGPREIIEDGCQGRLVRPRSPGEWTAVLHEMLDTPELLARMGREARPAVDPAFGLQRHLHDTLRAYESVLGHG